MDDRRKGRARALVLLAIALALALSASIAVRFVRVRSIQARASESAGESAVRQATAMTPVESPAERVDGDSARAEIDTPAEQAAAPAWLTIAGSVVDESGAPLPDARVRIHVLAANQSTPVAEPRADSSSDSAGHFEVQMSTSAPQIELRVSKSGYTQESDARWRHRGDVAARLDEVRLVVMRAGSLAGQLLWDSPLTRERLRVVVGSARDFQTVELDTDGHFVARDLTPGWAAVVLWHDRDFLQAIEPIDVRAGEESRDPRVNPLDLRGAYRALRARILRPDGAPLANEYVALWIEGAAKHDVRTDLEGRFVSILPTAVSRVLLDPPSFRSCWIPWSAEERVLTLAPPITLVLDWDAVLAAENRDVVVRVERVLDPGEESVAPDVTGSHAFDSSGRAEVVIEEPARYRVVWRLLGTAPPWEQSAAGEVVDVVDGAERQVFTLRLDKSQLAQFRESAGR